MKICSFFFFQAEDGIRDSSVTGVQTCALPIFREARRCGVRKECRLHSDRQGTVMRRQKKSKAMTEFHTVKRIDNSRIVRHVEPMKMRRLYRTVALGGGIASFFMLYIYQHFRCIDLSFQLEDVKGRQAEAASLNSSLKLEIAGLRNPMRIDVIARRQLGLTEPLPTQVQEYEAPDGAEVAVAPSLCAARPAPCFFRR